MNLANLNALLVDPRCTLRQGIDLAKEVLQEAEAYTTKRTTLGGNKYAFNEEFVKKLDETFEGGVIGNFSEDQKVVLFRYIDGTVLGEDDLDQDYLVQLDEYLSTITEEGL